MILDLDAGNTRLKWRLLEREGGQAVAWGATSSGRPDLSSVAEVPVSRVRLSSVLSEEREAALQDTIRALTGCSPQCAESRASELGLTNAYEDPRRLGVDRWLAMLAALQEARGPVCVVDIGTTMTFDAVDAAGRHLGGYIVPGLEMMAAAVYGDTGRVRKLQQVTEPDPGFGRSTEAAVGNGALAMLLALVERSVAQMASQSGINPAVVVTGGGAPALLSHLPPEIQYRRDLVLDGLALQIP